MSDAAKEVELSLSALHSHTLQLHSPSLSHPNDHVEHPSQPSQPSPPSPPAGEFVFSGDESGLVEQVRRLSEEEVEGVGECSICVMGEQVKPANLQCLLLTLLLGLCLLFPLLFFCCHWWKRAVSQVFQIRPETYRQIARLLKGKNVRKVTIKLYDNFFTEEKIKILARSLNKRAKITKLTLINEAGAFDMNDSEYTNFLPNAKAFLQLPIKQWHIEWYRQYLKQQTP